MGTGWAGCRVGGGWVVREGVPLFDGSLLTGSLNFHLYAIRSTGILGSAFVTDNALFFSDKNITAGIRYQIINQSLDPEPRGSTTGPCQLLCAWALLSCLQPYVYIPLSGLTSRARYVLRAF